MDEATSALDSQNEQLVMKSIENYRKSVGDITIVIVAHRLTTIKDADKIIAMKFGQVMEEGSHDELTSSHPDGVYCTFLK